MCDFHWQHIEFADHSNPYVSMTQDDFNWMQEHYDLVSVAPDMWKAVGKYQFYVDNDKKFDIFKLAKKHAIKKYPNQKVNIYRIYRSLKDPSKIRINVHATIDTGAEK